MTREQQLEFCSRCTNRKFDASVGLICGLTGAKAVFSDFCNDFIKDETVVETPSSNTSGDVPTAYANAVSAEEYEAMKLEQNLPLGVLAGIVVGLIGALLWGAITVATEYQIGFMAIAIGAGVGYTIRYFGKGLDLIFGISGALIALLSCALGNFFSIIGFIANSENLGYFETLTLLDYSMVPELMSMTFNPMDILFYGLAIYEGYKFSFRQVSI